MVGIALVAWLVVGIVGKGHAEYGDGIPHQLADLGIANAAVLLPWDTNRPCEELALKNGPAVAEAVFGLAEIDEPTSFYLTDFLVRQFEAFIIKPMGLDRHPELRDMYFGNYEKLVYQAQTDDPALTEKAQDCAARLGLAFERRFTGYGDLQTALRDL